MDIHVNVMLSEVAKRDVPAGEIFFISGVCPRLEGPCGYVGMDCASREKVDPPSFAILVKQFDILGVSPVSLDGEPSLGGDLVRDNGVILGDQGVPSVVRDSLRVVSDGGILVEPHDLPPLGHADRMEPSINLAVLHFEFPAMGQPQLNAFAGSLIIVVCHGFSKSGLW